MRICFAKFVCFFFFFLEKFLHPMVIMGMVQILDKKIRKNHKQNLKGLLWRRRDRWYNQPFELVPATECFIWENRYSTLYLYTDTFIHICAHEWNEYVYGSVFCNDVALLTRFTRSILSTQKHTHARTLAHTLKPASQPACIQTSTKYMCVFCVPRIYTYIHDELTNISTQSTSIHWSRRLCILLLFCLTTTTTHLYILTHTAKKYVGSIHLSLYI